MLFKRIISAVTGLAMAFGMIGVLPAAAEETSFAANSAQLSNTDMNIKGTNSFGRMLASALDEKSAEQNEGSGCNIYSVEVNGNVATADYQTTEDCTLVVGIYSEDGKEMLATGSAEVTADGEPVKITLDTENMPDYFYVKAFLVDSTMFRPLSVVYESPMYTKEMQELLAKTTDDFDADRVLNLDDDKTTNFAVYGENVILLNESDGVLSADGDTYTFTSAGERVNGLKKGDVFAYGDAENTVIVTVADISANGSIVTITDDPDAELEDVFECVKIEADGSDTEPEIDTSDLPEGVTRIDKGVQTNEKQSYSSGGVRTYSKLANEGPFGGELEGKPKFEIADHKWGKKYTGRDDDGKDLRGIKVSGSGSLNSMIRAELGTTAKKSWEENTELQYRMLHQ